MRRTPVLLAALVCAAVTGCAGSSSPGAASPEPSPESSPTSPSSSQPAPSSPSPAQADAGAGADQTIRVTYAGGKVSGDTGLVNVTKNSTVALIVTSDVADEVHLHGYDKKADVAKGGTVTLLFEATLPGRWVVELERSHRRLVQLQVR